MKKLLLILPFLFWFGCEDESEGPFSLVDEWVKCAYLSLEYVYEDSTTRTYDYIWDGLSVDRYRDGSLYDSRLYNNYGRYLYRGYVEGSKEYYEYDDGWKITRFINIDAYGDTLVDNSTYTWDGLTLTYNSAYSPLLITIIHNSYGRILLYTYTDSTGQESSRFEYTYKEDGRRMLEHKYYDDNELIRQQIYEWDGNTYERTDYYQGEMDGKRIGEINKYGVEVKREHYTCEGEDNCTWSGSREAEFDCDYFDPIPN